MMRETDTRGILLHSYSTTTANINELVQISMSKESKDGCVEFPFANAENNTNNEKVNSLPPTLPPATLTNIETVSLRNLKEELSNVPHDEKSSLVHAQRTTDLIDDDHLLRFLHVEKFDVNLALKRLLRYWKNRHKVFGDNYTLPMTLNGAMKDVRSRELLMQGFLVLLPVLDEAGRALIYANASKYCTLNPNMEEKTLLWWYLLHVAMENPSCRKNGFVILCNAKEARISRFDSKWALASCSSGDHDFYARWHSVHACHDNAVFPHVASAVKALLSERQRQSFILHNGSEDTVLKSLAEYSLPKRCIPTDLGGTLDISTSTKAFIEERLAAEGATSSNSSYIGSAPSEHTSHHVEAQQKPPSNLDIDGSQAKLTSNVNTSTGASMLLDDAEEKKPAAAGIGLEPVPSQQNCESNQTSQSTKRKVKKAGKTNAKKNDGKKKGLPRPGRAGDARMTKAVHVKLNNPDLSLVDALIAAGFVFPELNETEAKMKSTVTDTNGVALYQRRNQLMRRLRQFKEREKK